MLESYAKVRGTLLSAIPGVETVGIITAQNPNAQRFTNRPNHGLNRQLLADLHELNCGPINHCGALKIRGKYGSNPEDSFVVANIRRVDIVALANKYRQQAVIWGMKRQDRQGNPFFDFQWIENGQVTQHRSVSVSQPDVQSREDFYSAVKDRKFIIPFFDDPYANYEPGEKFGTIQQKPTIPIMQPPHREPDALPIFDEPPLRKAESFRLWFDRRKLLAEQINNH
jgi:hypothetical protein